MSSPYLGQRLLSNVPKDAVPQPLALKHTPIHPEDAAVYAYLRDQRAGGRVAYLPPVGISWPGDSPYSYEWSSAYSPKPFFLAFYNNPLGSEIISSLYAEQPTPHLDRLFGLASVRYVVYPHDNFFISYQDFQPTYRGEPVVDGFKNYKPVLDRALALQKGLEPVKRFDTVDLYRNPLAAPGVFAASRLLAVADASGKGANLCAAVMPDVVGLPFYQPGQAVIPAGDDPRFLELLGRVMGDGQGGMAERAYMTDKAGKRQAMVYEGRAYQLPWVEFSRQGDTVCRVRLSGVRSGFPLLFQETFHDGWKAYLVPVSERAEIKKDTVGAYRMFIDNDGEQATPSEVAGYVAEGQVSTLGDGRERARLVAEYGPGGKVIAQKEQAWNVDFVSRRFLTTVQNDNLPLTRLDATWREGSLAPVAAPGEAFDILAAASWKAEGAGEGRAIPWPELLHWQASGYGNAWWIDPALLGALGPDAARYARPNPAGGVDMELVIEFRPQRFYLLGLAVSALTVALALATLGALTVAARLRVMRVRRLNV